MTDKQAIRWLTAAAVAPGLTALERSVVNMALGEYTRTIPAEQSADLSMERGPKNAGRTEKKGQRGLRVWRAAETLPYTPALGGRY